MSALFTPELVLVILALALLVLDAFFPRLPKYYLGYFGGLGVAWALGKIVALIPSSLQGVIPVSHSFWTSFSLNEPYVLICKSIILISAFLTIVMLIDGRGILARFTSGSARQDEGTGELFILPLFATAGMMWMCSARDFISLFVALELTTLTFYIMVGFLRRNIGSLEGGVKYLITGAMAAGVMVMGIAWLYGTTGTFAFQSTLGDVLAVPDSLSPGVLLGLALVILGLAFKIGAVPMHVWVPDVYQGAPTPITALLSVASKTAGLCVFCTLMVVLHPLLTNTNLGLVFILITVATLIIGNLGAIPQTNVKRLMGYSSIGHAGFILPFLMLDYPESSSLMVIYLIGYLPMTFGAFFILSLIRNQTGAEDLNAMKGLAKRNPGLAAIATLMFASLAGVPLTGGFTAKFLSFKAMVTGQMWIVLGVAVVAAAAGFYYYFKPIRAMYWEKPDASTPVIRVPLLTGVMLAGLSLAVLALGTLLFQSVIPLSW